MRRRINNLISVVHSLMRFSFLKLFHWKTFKFNLIERFSPNVVVEINHGGRFELGKKVRVHSGSKLKIRSGAKLFIGDSVKVNYNCIFVCRDQIEIQEGVEFGPNVLIYDHDHDYRIGLKENEFKTSPVSIGKNCWIGANAIILKGTEIGDNCVVAAGTVVRGKIPAYSLVYQRRENLEKDIILPNEKKKLF